MKKNIKIQYLWILAVTLLGAFTLSCDKEDELYDPSFEEVDDKLLLDISEENIFLHQEDADEKVEFSWSTGTNYGTNEGIFYILQIDLVGNNFSFPLEYELGKQTYNFSLRYEVLNNILRNTYGVEAGDVAELSARITASVGGQNEDLNQIDELTFSATTYEPVSDNLYIIGSASPNGWDANNAIELARQDAGIFEFTGGLNEGDFKFITSLGEFLPSYNRGEDENTLFYRTSDDEPDEPFHIEENAVYTIKVNLLEETISISTVNDPLFNKLWIVGDGTESGWNVDSPVEFEQNENDPFIFEYEGTLTPGAMKIFAGPLGDWCGQWFRPLKADQEITNGAAEQNSGCDEDNTWSISEESQGRYKITVDTRKESVSINPVDLYIIGDAGPNGWNIETPEPMAKNGSIYTYSGPLGETNATGEFKISKFLGDWCNGEWINPASNEQLISNTDFIYTQGCEGPDNKWKLQDGEAGNYTITIDLEQEFITIESI